MALFGVNGRRPTPRFWLILGGLAGAAALGVFAYQARLAPDRLGAYTTSLVPRDAAQRLNIRSAARRLDGLIVPAGASFSFNAAVGPRTLARGFAPAPGYMEASTAPTIGGGVCQVSSTLYAALQETALPISERVAHGYAVSSVPAGRDAAVAYGGADLRFVNASAHPIRLEAELSEVALSMVLWGTRSPETASVGLRFSYRPLPGGGREVCVYRKQGEALSKLSCDRYRAR